MPLWDRSTFGRINSIRPLDCWDGWPIVLFLLFFYLSLNSSFDHHSQKQNQLGNIYIYNLYWVIPSFGVLQNNLTTLLK